MNHNVGVLGTGFVGTAVSVGLEHVSEVREYDKFKDSENLDTVVNNSDILFVCVPTPMLESGHCDTSVVEEICFDISKVAEKRKMIVIKSTVPPGTTQTISNLLNDKHAVFFNPEFLTEANFIDDFLEQDRILLGKTKSCKQNDCNKLFSLYEDFVYWQEKKYDGKILSTIIFAESEEVEMVKYMTNCFLAAKVSFCNEMYDICNVLDIEYDKVKELVLLDSRIGKTHMNVPGHDGYRMFGGKCLVKDLNALIALAEDFGVDPIMLETVWSKCLMNREVYDWENIKGATYRKVYE